MPLFQSQVDLSDWTSNLNFNTKGWTTNTTYSMEGRRVGDTLECAIRVTLSGAPDTATFSLDDPVFNSITLTIDEAKLPWTSGEIFTIGTAGILDTGTANRSGEVRYNGQVQVWTITAVAGSANSISVVTQAVPQTWASGDKMYLHFYLPISGW